MPPACGDVNAIPENIVLFDDHVAEVDTDPKQVALVRGGFLIVIDRGSLHLGGAANRVNHARKFYQHAVSSRLDDAPAMFGYLIISPLRPECLHLVSRFVRPEQE
jgi:hypothetical protein